MKQKKIFFGFYIFYFIALANDFNIKLIKTIGDDRPDYSFFIIADAKMNEDKEIFICDGRGCFISKFDWEKGFIKKIGSKGEGTGDFQTPGPMDIFNDIIYVFDSENRRVVELDFELNIKNYLKLKDTFYLSFFCFSNNLFLGDLNPLPFNRERIGIINTNGEIIKKIFLENPLKEKLSNLSSSQIVKLSSISKIRMALDHLKNIYVTFCYINKSIDIYMYSSEGDFKKIISLPIDNKYTFPKYLLDSPSKDPENISFLTIDSLFYWKNLLLFNLCEFDKNYGKTVKEEFFLCGIDLNGKLIFKKKLDGCYRFFCITQDGYILAKRYDEEIEKLYIFKINELK